MKTILLLFSCFWFGDFAKAQIPELLWQKHYGGANGDGANAFSATKDGGFILCGYSLSKDIPGQNPHGGYNFMIVKTDSLGNEEWIKIIGSPGDDIAYDIKQTRDMGFIVVGFVDSKGGDVSSSVYKQDAWLVKLDKKGEIEWERTYGWIDYDRFYSIEQLSDGGYVACGLADGFVNSWRHKLWVVRLDSKGNPVWNYRYGETAVAMKVRCTNNGDVLLAGQGSYDETIAIGGWDFWVMKLDSSGKKQWLKSYGSVTCDNFHDMDLTSDGGAVLTGVIPMWDEPFTSFNYQFTIVKIDGEGNETWRKGYGGAKEDESYAIKQTSDQGFIVAGRTKDSALINKGGWDLGLMKVDSAGQIMWQKSFGGSQDENASSIIETRSGKYFIAGETSSWDFDAVGSLGYSDFWLVQLGYVPIIKQDSTSNDPSISQLSSTPSDIFAVYPNPVTSGNLFINYLFEGKGKSFVIQLKNMLGQSLITRDYFVNGQTLIDLTGIAEGAYYLSVQNDNVNYIKKILIK